MIGVAQKLLRLVDFRPRPPRFDGRCEHVRHAPEKGGLVLGEHSLLGRVRPQHAPRLFAGTDGDSYAVADAVTGEQRRTGEAIVRVEVVDDDRPICGERGPQL